MKKPPSYSDPAVVADLTAAAAGTDYKALVCVFPFGANDSYNTVPPKVGPNREAYDKHRPNIGIPIDAMPANDLNEEWRLHPALVGLKQRWDEGKLGVLMNVGMLQEPTTKEQYESKSVELPRQLFSHNSQQQEWMALPVANEPLVTGWFGRAIDLAGQYFNVGGVPALFSLDGRQKQMLGYEVQSSDMQPTGASKIELGVDMGSDINTANRLADARVRSEYDNVLQSYFAEKVAKAIASQESIYATLLPLPPEAEARFTAVPDNDLAQKLKAVTRAIFSRYGFAHRRQTFFVGLPGFDQHADLREVHDAKLATVDQALSVFWDALGDIGMRDSVTTFTESDFGRALFENGRAGCDHGWGGHHFVMGGAVNGGIYGTPPDMTIGGPNDSGQGRLIPTTSFDQYAATLLRWWGIPAQHIPLVINNLPKFSPQVIPNLLP